MTVARAALVDAAADLNKVLLLDPEIDVKLGVGELRENVVEAARLVSEGDALATSTRAVLAELDGSADTFAPTDDYSATDKEAKKSAGAAEKKAAIAKKRAEREAAQAAVKAERAKPKLGRFEPKDKLAKAPAAPRAAPQVGEFKPIRRGSQIHKFVDMALSGRTLSDMAKIYGPSRTEGDIRWWLCQYLRRHHGIGCRISDDRTVEFVFPAGKGLEDCIAKAA
jgi:hypothetical protein